MRAGCRWPAALCGAILSVASPAMRAALPHLDLEVALDPAARSLRAVAQWTVSAPALRVALHQSLAVESVSLDGMALRAAGTPADGGFRTWSVALPRPGTLRIAYAGTLPPMEAGLDDRGVLRSLPPMASPRGSYLPAGSGWYPEPGPLFTYRLALSLPEGQRGLVEGRLVSEESAGAHGGQFRAVFEFDAPAEGIHLMAGPYVVRERMLDRAPGPPVRVRTYFYPEIAGLSQGYLDDSASYLERYARLIGPYPYTEFSVVAGPLPTGFGMPTLTYLGAEVIKLPFIRGTSLGHEILHNWWGNGVRAEVSRGNWSEGLTTFMADYAYKEDESAQAAAAQRLAWLRDFAAVPEEERKPLTAFRSRTHGADAAVGYGKAAMLFVMLRDLIGAEAFQRGVHRFWEQARFEAASWDDLRRAFEETSRRPLRTFFEQWLERPGGPALKIERARAVPSPQPDAIGLELALTQPAPAYALRVPVEIVYEAGVETREIDVYRERETVRLDLPRRAIGVRLDPELQLWRILDPAQVPPILRRWIVARSPRLAVASRDTAVRRAAQELATALFEAPHTSMDAAAITQSGGPVLLVGLHEAVDAALARAGLAPQPGTLAGRGSVQAWTVREDAGRSPLMVISGKSAEALRAVARPLPHYGTQSWVVFEGARAIERGIWPSPAPLVPVAP
jgi:hypothetical protein